MNDQPTPATLDIVPSVEQIKSNSTSEVDDPLSPDAPIHHLLSVSKNPRIATMSNDELVKLVQKLRTLAASPQTMSAKIQSESKGRKSKPLTAEQLRRKEILDSL
jgi:hypothetical protein